MRICMLSELFYPYLLGGAERRYWEIARRLAKRGHDVTVFSLRFPGYPDEEVVEGVKIRRIGGIHPLSGRAPRRLFSFWPAIAKAFSSNFDLIDVNQGAASFAGIWKLLKLTKRPIVATFHDIYSREDWKRYFRWPGTWLSRLLVLGWSLMSYSKVIANSRQTERKLHSTGIRNTEVILSGVDYETIRKIKPKRLPKTIIYVGRLEEYKHVDLLIKAIASDPYLKGYKLLIAGKGPEKESLQRLAAKLKVKTEFLGYVSDEEKVALIKGADILVNPSTVEGLGLILLEGMACGTPVVGFDLRCYREFCTPDNSTIVKAVDEKDLAKSMAGLLKGKKKYSLIKNGLETAEMFSWERVTDRIEELYERLLQ